VPVRKLTLCRVTVSMTGAEVGEIVNVDLSAPGMDSLVEGGYLVPQPEPPAPPAMAEILVAEATVEASETPQEPPGDDATPDAAPSTPEP
jgi:hypothetical protein